LVHRPVMGQFNVEAVYAASWRGKLAAAGANCPTTHRPSRSL